MPNNTGYVAHTYLASKDKEMAAFDALPPPLRVVVREADFNVSAEQVSEVYHRFLLSGVPNELAVLRVVQIVERTIEKQHRADRERHGRI